MMALAAVVNPMDATYRLTQAQYAAAPAHGHTPDPRGGITRPFNRKKKNAALIAERPPLTASGGKPLRVLMPAPPVLHSRPASRRNAMPTAD